MDMDMDMDNLKQLVKMAGKMIIKALLRKFAPYLIGFGSLLLIAFLAYYAIFEMPKNAVSETVDNAVDQVRSFFYGTKEEQEQDVVDKYKEVANRWDKGLDDFQRSQVDPYNLPWGWLAIVDRTLNDPNFVKTYVSESDEESKKEVVLKPKAMFKEVRPIFTWEKKEIKTEEEVSEISEEDETKTITKTVTTVETKSFLVKARTMQNEFVYAYEPTVTKNGKQTVYGFAVTSITTQLEDWEPLKDLLTARKTSEKDQEFLMEYWKSYLVSDDFNGGFLPSDDWMPSSGTLTWPTPDVTRITSTFGVRVHPISGETKMHNGIDVGAPTGTDIVAAGAGSIVYASDMGSAGNSIMINHGNGLETRYYHLSSILVTVGQEVRSGELIGKVGSTGGSTGPHLHFEIRINGEPTDPLAYFGNTESPFRYRPLNIEAVKKFLQGYNSALATESTLRMIDAAGKAKNVDPHLLIAITGAEQSFVPASHPQADRIIRNPWNVYGFWSKGKGATLTTEEAARIAANTIIKLSKDRPEGENPIHWLSSRKNPRGYYAGNGEEWTQNTSIYYEKLLNLE